MNVDIVNLIETNPITKISGDYQSKLVEKVKKSFTNYEQQLFLSSFYCYLKYDSKNDFVIDLDNVWKWLEFSNKAHAKTVLTKNFLVNKDYKFLLTKSGEQSFDPQVGGTKKDTRGGHNKEIIMLNVDTFKRFCLKAGTIANGYYYFLYNNCDEDLICDFEEKHGKPLLYKNGVGQFDNENNLVKEFACKYDCIKELKMSDKTLAKCINNSISYNGYYYKEIGEKLVI